MFVPAPTHRLSDVVVTPFSEQGGVLSRPPAAPASATLIGGRAILMPLYLLEPFVVAKAFWLSGATVGTDSLDIGVYRMVDFSTGRCELIRSCGLVLSAGSANVVQETSTWRTAAGNLTSGADSTDAAAYTTASVTLKAGRLYLLSFVNTAASAAAISSIAGGGSWTSRSTTQYNGTAHRLSIWSCVPTTDYTGTIVVTFGGTQTGGRWSLEEFSGVDTSSNDGIVQQATGTGNSTTPLATLGAFASANNATFGANANTADSTTTPGTGFTELSDLTTATTPASFLQTQWRVDNDTTSDGTITSGQWGSCAVEIKADTATPFVIPPCDSRGDIYMAFGATGTTVTVFSAGVGVTRGPGGGILQVAANIPLQPSVTAVAPTAGVIPVAGFSRRSLLG